MIETTRAGWTAIEGHEEVRDEQRTNDRPQPRPYSAMELIHKQPVRWTHDRIVSCDGGGGPLGHPRIFINVDKPQICWCTYCGLPFVCAPRERLYPAQFAGWYLCLTYCRLTSTTAHTSNPSRNRSFHTRSLRRVTLLRSMYRRESQTSRLDSGKHFLLAWVCVHM